MSLVESTESCPATVTLGAAGIVAVGGRDRHAFLQGQLTQDVGRASDTATVLAGWADAKGRLLWAGHLFAREEWLCLLVPGELAETLVARLRRFVLRAKATVTVQSWKVVGVIDPVQTTTWSPGWQVLGMAGDPTRRLLIGAPSVLTDLVAAAGRRQASPAVWRLRDIRAGLPEITAATTGEFVPQMVNLDLLDAISFSKGCYSGQEIVARTRYLGRVRRRMLRFALSGVVPAPGDPIYAGGGVVGQVVNSQADDGNGELLAVMRLDAWPGPFFADAQCAQPLQRLPLPYRIPELED